MNFFHFYIRISFDKWAFRISKLEYLTGWICYITQHHILLIYWVSTSLGGAETISDCWFHSIFQFFWDDDPYDDNECYQTYQTFKPGKTEKKTENPPGWGCCGFSCFFTRTLGGRHGPNRWNRGLEQRASGLGDCRAQRQIGWGRPGVPHRYADVEQEIRRHLEIKSGRWRCWAS